MAGERKSAVLLSLLVVFATVQSRVNAQVNNVNPQFVFVHGIGHGGWCFTPLITLLQKAGYTATAIDLTSQGINKAAAEDVLTVAQYLEPLTSLFETAINKPTILVGHSLGGAVIAVIAEMFSYKVAKAVWLAGVYPSNHNTFFNALPPSDENPDELVLLDFKNLRHAIVKFCMERLQRIGVEQTGHSRETLKRLVGDGNLILNGSPPTSASLNVRNLTAFFYNKSPEEGVNLASTLVVPTPYRPGTEPITLTSEKFGAIRKFYIQTLADLGITPTEQQEMIDVNLWKPERKYELPNADHGAYFSQKTALARILIDIAKTP